MPNNSLSAAAKKKSTNTVKCVHAKPGVSAGNESRREINTFAQVSVNGRFSCVKRMTSITQTKIFHLKVQQGCTWIIISDNTGLKIAQRTQTNKYCLHGKSVYSLIEKF